MNWCNCTAARSRPPAKAWGWEANSPFDSPWRIQKGRTRPRRHWRRALALTYLVAPVAAKDRQANSTQFPSGCMNTFNSSLYAIAFMSCVLCSFVFRSSRLNRPHYSYLSAYLVLESCTFILQWLMLHPTSPGKSLWLGLLMCLSLLLAPCLWLYARQLTHPSQAAVRSLSGMQVAMIAAGMLLTLPLIQRSHLGPDYADPRHVASKLQSLFIHGTM